MAAVGAKRGEDASGGGEELLRKGGPATSLRGLGAERGGPGAGALGEAPEAHVDSIVQPDHGVRPRPDQVTDRALVAISDPALAGDRLAGALAQDGRGRGAEVRAEVQRVQLDMRHTARRGKFTRERRLAGAGAAEDEDPLASGQAVQGIALPCHRRQRYARTSAATI